MSTRTPIRHQGIVFLISITLLSFLLVILVNGCTKQHPMTPVDVYIEFYRAMLNNDKEKTESFCTPKFLNSKRLVALKMLFKSMPKPPTSEMTGAERKKAEEVFQSTFKDFMFSIDGNTARVWPKDHEYQTYLLVKENGQWKLDELLVDMDGMLESYKKEHPGEM